jgi:uncharacterized cofD-like protein
MSKSQNISAVDKPSGLRIVALGGGTGLSALLRGLKGHVAQHAGDAQPIAELTAVVTVTDDGGSSGRLRREYQILPPGDIRNCMVALSHDEPLLSRLFQYRFSGSTALGGHSFGNLFLTAMTHITGDFNEAVKLSGEVLAIRGRIYPSTLHNVRLEAVLENGKRMRGETKISQSRAPIRRVHMKPRNARALAETLYAISQADLITFGPGSLYTSVIPNLLVRGVVQAIRKSRARRVYIGNLMTQPGETTGMCAAAHIRAVYDHSVAGLFDTAVLNNGPISPRMMRKYAAQGAVPVEADAASLGALGVRCIFDHLAEEHDGVLRHNAARLTRLLLEEFGRNN